MHKQHGTCEPSSALGVAVAGLGAVNGYQPLPGGTVLSAAQRLPQRSHLNGVSQRRACIAAAQRVELPAESPNGVPPSQPHSIRKLAAALSI